MTPIQWVAKKINDLGFDLYKQTSLAGSSHHLINGHVPVVIKVAYQSDGGQGRNRWQWKVDNPPPKSTFILVAVDDSNKVVAFIVPWEVAQNRTRYEINSHPTKTRGYMARYLDDWQYFVRELASEVVA